MGPPKCQICKEAHSKYKCPTCLLQYCSLPCYKRHKETPCKKAELALNENGNGTEEHYDQPPRPFEDDDDHPWRLQKSQFELLAASREIREMLKDPELQKLIRKIDSSSEVEKDLHMALDVEMFKEFRDKILETVNKDQK